MRCKLVQALLFHLLQVVGALVKRALALVKLLLTLIDTLLPFIQLLAALLQPVLLPSQLLVATVKLAPRWPGVS
jgi:hypothetical protein